MYFVYILTSKKDGSRYIGVTNNLKARLIQHNQGHTQYTNSKKPFYLSWYCIFSNKISAYRFEKYLKSGSGRAFINKHLS